MSALTGIQAMRHNQGDIGYPQVAAATIIYLGAMVGIVPSTGYARPYQTGDFFAGHAQETVDNSAGAAGALRVPVLRGLGGGYFMTVPVFNSTTVAHIGDSVWSTTDNHADLTRSDPGSTMTTTDKKGIIHDVDPLGNVIVKFLPTC